MHLDPALDLRLRPMREADWPAVRLVYLDGLASRQATFETVAPEEWAVWSAGKLEPCRIVAERGAAVVGWAALSPVSSRAVYRGVAEVSVYVASAARGGGIGGALLEELVRASEAAGIWTLQASVFPENEASVALHLRHGFRVVGRRERIAQHHGVWRDTVLLERRSAAVAGGPPPRRLVTPARADETVGETTEGLAASGPEGGAMSIEATRAVMAGYWERGERESVAEDAVYTDMATGERMEGRDAVFAMLQRVYRKAFDVKSEDQRFHVGDGWAVAEATLVGTHVGEYAGVEATGAAVRVPLCVVYEVEHGAIARARVYFMRSAFLEQVAS